MQVIHLEKETGPSILYAQMISDLFSEIMHKTMTVRLLDEVTETEISVAQFQVLRYLYTHGRCTVGHIAEGLMISHPAATKLVQRLVEKGFIHRNEGANDRRIAELDLTPQGRDLVQLVKRLRTERMARILARMSPEDRECLFKGLTQFIASAVQDREVGYDICLRCGSEALPECPINEAQSEVLGPSLANP